MAARLTLDAVLDRHRVGVSAEEIVSELDAALTAAADSGTTPLSEGEITFLGEHGGPGVGEALGGWSAAAESRGRAHAATRRIADALAGSLSVTDAAQSMGVDRSRISHRLREGTLWSFTLGRHRRIPAWQILPGGKPMPGLSAIVAAIPDGLDPRSVAAFMNTAQPDLGDQAPLAYLAGGGDPAMVADLLGDLGRW